MTHGGHDYNFKKRLIVSALITIPILLLSPTIQNIFAFSIAFPGHFIALFLLVTFVYGYGGWPFLKGCILELQEKKVGMMSLIAMAITSAHVYSGFVIFDIIGGKPFFWEVATLIDVMLLGHWIEMRTVMKSGKALKKLASLLPATAHLMTPDGSTKDVAQTTLKPGDLVLIKPGEKIPADGIVTQGYSDINQAALTGESKPAFKKTGDSILGGSLNGTGSLVVQITKSGKELYLSKIIDLVKQAQASKSKAQTLANKAAFILTLIALIAGGSTFLWWIHIEATTNFALERMITVMVITCPHALGLAIPLVVAGITGLAAQHGFLIRNRTAFESARKSKIVLFDKTGTLTTGRFGIADVISYAHWNEQELIAKAAALEKRSEHTIAKAIADYAQKKNIVIPHIANFKALPGLGVRGLVGEDELFVGSLDIITTPHSSFQTNFVVHDLMHVLEQAKKLITQGKTVIVVATKKEIKGLIALSDTIREESFMACKKLHSYGIQLAMMTGDQQEIANDVAQKLGIIHVFANVMPDQKATTVKELQEKGYTVIMVGDGINDAPALAQANVGIAIGAGTDIAAQTADIILVKNDPRDVAEVIRLSKTMFRKTLQNLFWATSYNIAAIPLAAGVLYHKGILLSPALGALIMSISTIIVAINARLIQK